MKEIKKRIVKIKSENVKKIRDKLNWKSKLWRKKGKNKWMKEKGGNKKY